MIALLLLAPLLQQPAPAAGPVEDVWRRFPVFVWRQQYRGRALPDDLVQGLGGTNVEGADEAAWVLGGGHDFYVGHAPGRDSLHLERSSPAYRRAWDRWYEERDDRWLVRDPCLSDPAARLDLLERLRTTLAAREGRHGIGVSLGDEVSLTPWGDPLGLCLSPTCRAGWEAFAAERRGWSGEELAPPSTDATRLALIDGRREPLDAWLLRREYHQQVMLDCLIELAAEARRVRPGVPVGLLGMAGRTAFGGVAIERILPHLDFAEAYAVSDSRELLMTLRRPEQRALATVFPRGDCAADGAWQAWQHFIRGGDGIVVWSDRVLMQHPPAGERLRQAVADIRRVRRLLPGFRPRPGGVAIAHSPASVAVSWMRDALLDGPTWPRRFQGTQEREGSRERDLRAWLRLLEDCGLQPGAIPMSQVSAKTVERFPVLVLNHLLVLDREDLDRLLAFQAAGGGLWVCGDLGWVDSRGGRLGRVIDNTLSFLPPPVADRGIDHADYAVFRSRSDPWAARHVRLVAARWMEGLGLPPLPPWPLGEGVGEPDRREDDEVIPWLRAMQYDPVRDLWMGAGLPNLPDPSNRAEKLEPFELRAECPDGWQLRWIHPRVEGPSVTLPAGDAVVFVLLRD